MTAPDDEPTNAPSWTEWTRAQRITFVAIIVALLTVVVPAGYMATDNPSKLIDQGAVVEPGRGRDVVYVDDKNPQIRCTATTSNGESVALAPFTGPDRKKSLGSRAGATKFWAVAVLPTDRGPLRISCPPHRGSVWIAAPDDNTWLFVFMGAIVALTVGIAVVAVKLRKQNRPNGARE